MVRRYHSHLYKTHVIADFSKYETPSSQIGLRWRTEAEVSSGMGVDTCGNKHCPCYYINSVKGTKVKAKVEDVVIWSKTRQYLTAWYRLGLRMCTVRKIHCFHCFTIRRELASLHSYDSLQKGTFFGPIRLHSARVLGLPPGSLLNA